MIEMGRIGSSNFATTVDEDVAEGERYLRRAVSGDDLPINSARLLLD